MMTELVKVLINKMLEPHDIDYDHVMKHPQVGEVDWYVHYTRTSEQALEFKEWAIKVIRKGLRCSNAVAEQQFAWFDLMWGLRVSDS